MNDVNDAISRQQAIETFKDCAVNGVGIDGIVDALNQLPPAEPKRIHATWISKVALQDGQITLMDYNCSNCSHHRGKPMNFCEVCGAKMER